MATVVSNYVAEKRIKSWQEFRNQPGKDVAPWSGRPGGADSLGSLPSEHHQSAQAARYVVYSYETPIGWIDYHGNPRIPDVGYSLTTSQHQYATAHAWGLDFRPQRGRELRPSGGGHRRGGMDDQ